MARLKAFGASGNGSRAEEQTMPHELDDFEYVRPSDPPPLQTALVADHATRQEQTRRAAEQAGISWPSTVLPEGTALYASGTAKLKADRARWRKLPNARDGLSVVKAALLAEDRRDFKVQVSDLRFDETTGRLYNQNAAVNCPEAGYDDHAFHQLLAQVPGCAPGQSPRGFAGSLLYLRDSERASILNARIGSAKNSIVVRTKLDHGGNRVARAALTERYADVSDIDVGEGLVAGLNGDLSTCKLDYRPGDERSQFEVIWPSEVPVNTFCVGDVHYAMMLIKNSETGEGALKIQVGLMRAACANLTLASGDGIEISLRHMGSAQRVVSAMRAAIMSGMGQIAPLRQSIQLSVQERVEDCSNMSPSDVLRALAKENDVTKDRANAWVQTYERGYASSPTTWGITSAITEAAQGAGNWMQQQDEEEVAANVLHVTLRRAL